jgi:regulation of enolase protein 1 (concanavalin A-like superfamily)
MSVSVHPSKAMVTNATTQTVTDGSSIEDAPEAVEIDLQDPTDRWRYTCPVGHRDFSRTNNHVWCYPCARAAEQGVDVDPEYYELLDQKSGETIPWSAVRVVGDE